MTEALAQEQPRVQVIQLPKGIDSHWNTKLFGLTILVAAFLLFQVQLILGKYILPWFGVTPSVWTTCLLFFQVLLLAGYAYAHFLAMKLSPAKQRGLHTGLLGISIVFLIALAFYWPSPITPSANWKPQDDSHPIGVILRFLLAGIGLPFLLVSTTGPLLQHWFAESNPGASPYRLYSLSNVGSLLGLISYPFLIEPHLRLHTQAWMWGGELWGICPLPVLRAPAVAGFSQHCKPNRAGGRRQSLTATRRDDTDLVDDSCRLRISNALSCDQRPLPAGSGHPLSVGCAARCLLVVV